MPDTPDPGSARASTVGWSPFEVLAAGFLVAVLVTATVVWAGAALAAVLTGGRFTSGLSDAIPAALRLRSHAGDPASAWPPHAAASLPGPFLYWASTGLVAAAALGVAVGGARVVGRLRPVRRRLGVDVRARFATARELRPLLIDKPVRGRFVVGRFGRWLVATENLRFAPPRRRWCRLRRRGAGATSVAIVGPSQSGKTSQCAIPGVLEWEGPAVLLSVKRDLLDATIRRRRALGKVKVFDPAGLVSGEVEDPGPDYVQIERDELARWSPLRNAGTPTGAKKAGEALASWTPKAGLQDGGHFWASEGKILFTGLLATAALDPTQPSMHRLAKWVFTQDMPRPGQPCDVNNVLKDARNDPARQAAADHAALHLHAIWSKHDELVSSVYATAQTVVDPYLDPAVQAATELDGPDAAWVDLTWLLDVSEGKANTLYLVVPLDDYERLAPVLGGLLSDLKAQAYEWDVRGRRVKAPLLMLIDEAGNMPLAWLPQVASTCAGIGIQLVTIWQSLGQIEEAYGRLANSVLTNHATKLFFPAASDDSTLGYQSRIAGHEEVERRSWTDSAEGRRSISGSPEHEPLIPYHVPRLAPSGRALMIHGNLPPAVIRGRYWKDDRRLHALARGEPPNDDGPAHGDGAGARAG